MFFVGFAAMPFMKFYQSLVKLVFDVDEQDVIVDMYSDASSSQKFDDSAEKNIGGLLQSQSSNHLLFN